MTSIKLTVTGARARAAVEGVLTSGAVGIPVVIHYDSAWDGLTKNLLCRNGKLGPDGAVRMIANVEDSATVAHEVMTEGHHLYIGMEGRNSDGSVVISTVWADCGYIHPGASVNALPAAKPTQPIWAQLQQQINDLKDNEGNLCTGDILLDDTLSQSGMAADAKAVGDALNNLSVGGMTTEQIHALDSMFQVCAFVKSDVSAEYGAFRSAFGIADSGEEHTHSYTSAVTAAATCTSSGTRVYTCSCGDSYTEEIPAAGHNYVDAVCSVCGAAEPEDETPPVTLSGISADYSGGEVAVGTAVTDLTGIVVTAHYSDGTAKTVTDYTLSGTIAEGENTVTVDYGGITTTFTVTGVAESGAGSGSGTEINDYSVLEKHFVQKGGDFKSNSGYNTAYFEVLAGDTYTSTAMKGQNAPQFLLTNSGYAGTTANVTVLDVISEQTTIGEYTTTYTVPQDGCLLIPYYVTAGITIIKE